MQISTIIKQLFVSDQAFVVYVPYIFNLVSP